MSGSRPSTPDADPISGVQYAESETGDGGTLYDSSNDDAWLQSTLIVSIEP